MFYRLLFLSLFMMINCSSQRRKTMQNPSEKSDIIYLKQGETKFVDAVQMNVTFSKFVNDSRCPKGTTCVWQGVGTVEITLMSTHSRPVTYTLNTNSVPGKSYSKLVKFDGYTVSLEDLSPYPDAKNSKINPKDYTIGLKFQKGTMPQRGEATTMPIQLRVSRAEEDSH